MPSAGIQISFITIKELLKSWCQLSHGIFTFHKESFRGFFAGGGSDKLYVKQLQTCTLGLLSFSFYDVCKMSVSSRCSRFCRSRYRNLTLGGAMMFAFMRRRREFGLILICLVSLTAWTHEFLEHF